MVLGYPYSSDACEIVLNMGYTATLGKLYCGGFGESHVLYTLFFMQVVVYVAKLHFAAALVHSSTFIA